MSAFWRRELGSPPCSARVIRAMMPPPRLSARMMKATYLRGDHDQERPQEERENPETLSGVMGTGWWALAKTSLMAYRGLGADIAIDYAGWRRGEGREAVGRGGPRSWCDSVQG